MPARSEARTGMSAVTPGQTVGPYLHMGMPYPGGPELVPPGRPGAVRLTGLVLDGAGKPVPDALVEIWQPDASGAVVRLPGSLHRDGWTFTGFGRDATDGSGRYSFTTVRPGPTKPGGAPFFAVTVFARGLLDRLFTRAYLPGHEDDPFLAALPQDRRRTMIVAEDGDQLTFDIRLNGTDETVFLDFREPPVG
jgi:protocatechuate 3,4-dioxygenase alpha subunit